MKQIQGEGYSSQSSYKKVLQPELTQYKGELAPIIFYQIRDFFQKYEIQILENRLYDIQIENQNKYGKLEDQRTDFKQALESHLLHYNEKDLSNHQQLISLIKQYFFNKMNEQQINQIIDQWQSIRLASFQISQIFDNYKLDNLIQTPGLLDIIANAIYHHQFHNQYEFYNFIIFEVIENHLYGEPDQQNRDNERIESIFHHLELIAINYIIKKQNTQVLEEFIHYSKPWIKYLLKSKQIVDFLIARHFERWLSKLSNDQNIEFKNEIDVFKAIRNQSKIGMINFLKADFIGVIQYLKEFYYLRDNCKIRLIKMIQASAIINDFEQEAGNSMSVLSSLESIIRNQDLSKINLKNSTMNNIQFISTNFNGSIMNNVSIVSAQFIDCSLQNVNWQNLESSYLNILKGNQTLFSQHKSILINIIFREEMCHPIFNLSFYNLQTGKQIKSLFNQSKNKNSYGKQILKLSCLGQVIVFNQESQGNSIFWSIQCQKKIRVHRGDGEQGKNVLSGDCQTMALKNTNHVSLWKIYNNQQNLEIQVKNVYRVRFQKNNQILMILFQGFWDCKNGKEIKSIQNEGEMWKFSPDGLHYTTYEQEIGLVLRKINDDAYAKLLQGTNKNYIYNLKFSPDGKVLAFWDTQSIQLWTVQDQKPLQTFDQLFASRGQFKQKFKFSPDGQTLALVRAADIVLWNFNQGRQFIRIEGFNIIKIRFSCFGQHLILQNNNYSRLWNFLNQQKYLNSSNNELLLIPDSISFSCCTSHLCLIYGCEDKKSKTIKIKICNDVKVINEIYFDKNSKVTSFALSPDFFKIAFFYEQTVFIKKIEDGQIYDFQKIDSPEWQGNIRGQKLLKFSPNGEYFIVFMQTQISRKTDWWSIQLWEIENKIQIYQTAVNNDKGCREHDLEQFEFSNDSQNLAIPYFRKINIVNIVSKELKNLEFEEYYLPQTLAFSADVKFLACDNYDYNPNDNRWKFKIYIWKVNDGLIIQRLRAHNKKIKKILFLNEDIIASASEDFTIKIWNWQLEQQIQVLNYHKCGINHLSVSPDRSMMVSQDCEGTVYLWRNIETQNHNDQLKTEISFKETGDNQSQNHKLKYFYIPHSVLSSPRFRSVNCQLNGSQFFSTEGFNLQNVFNGIENYLNF